MSGEKGGTIHNLTHEQTAQLITVQEDRDSHEEANSLRSFTEGDLNILIESKSASDESGFKHKKQDEGASYDGTDVREDSLSERTPESSDNDGVVYEHTLRHRSFVGTPRQRRRKYLDNRRKGTAPKLHFSGTRKTDFWKQYGVDPDEILPQGNTLDIDSIFTEDEFNKFGPIERRIHITGQKFKVVGNRETSYSLHRAIAQALGMSEDSHKIVREAIYESVAKYWSVFCKQICDICGQEVTESEAHLIKPKLMIDKYKKLVWPRFSAPELELAAAAVHYGFSCVIIDISEGLESTFVRHCQPRQIPFVGTVKFYFLISGSESPYFEFLVPIGPPKRILEGQYSTFFRDVILVQRSKRFISDQTRKAKHQPDVGQVPIGFGVDHRVFFHRSTVSHDLWSLLAELMFKKLIHAPQIKHRVVDRRHDYTLCYLACKAKKRFQMHGSASVNKLAEDFTDFLSTENPRGDLEDLAQAAVYFDFSYTVIGLDFRGNFFWRDYVSKEEISQKNGPYLAFFVKTTTDNLTFWYALEDVGRSCPKERKLYQAIQAGDLSPWSGRFYFHDLPKSQSRVQQNVGTGSTKNLLHVPTHLFSQAVHWTRSNMSKFGSIAVQRVSAISLKPMSLVRTIYEALKRFTRKRKVNPDKRVEAVYVRDRP